MSKMWFVNDYPQHFLATNYQYPFISMIISEKFFSSFLGGLQYWYDMSQTWSFFSSKWKYTQIVRGNNDDHIEAWVWITFHQRCGGFVSKSMKSNFVFENPFKWSKYTSESMIFFLQNAIILKFEHFADIALICFKRSGLSHFSHIVSDSEHCSINNN